MECTRFPSIDRKVCRALHILSLSSSEIAAPCPLSQKSKNIVFKHGEGSIGIVLAGDNKTATVHQILESGAAATNKAIVPGLRYVRRARAYAVPVILILLVTKHPFRGADYGR